MKPRNSSPFRSHASITAAFSVALFSHFSAPFAFADTYYWDNNGGTAGFGTAAGTWMSTGTVGSATTGWGTSATGAVTPTGTITTLTTDTVNFGGTGTGNGMAAGSVAITGIVNTGNLNFGSANTGSVNLTGGTINFAAAVQTSVGSAQTSTISSTLTGAGTSYTKAGQGLLVLTGNNTGFGQGGSAVFNITRGTVRVGTSANALGGATGFTVNLGDTSANNYATALQIGNSFSLANKIIVVSGLTGTATLANSGNPNPGVFSGDITANDNLTVSWTGTANGLTVSGTGKTIADTKTVTFSATGTGGTLTDSAAWGGLGKIAYGGNEASSISISGAKTFSGGATLNAMSGTGTIAVAANSTPTSGTVTSGPFGSGTLTINAAKVRASTSADFTVGNAITLGGNPTFPKVASEKSLTLTGPVDLGAATRILTVDVGSTVAGKMVDFQGVISSATATSGLTKAGTGTLTLSGANTYTGNTTVTGGTLNITGAYSGDSAASSLLLGTTAAKTVVNVSNNMTLAMITGGSVANSFAVYNQTAGTVTSVGNTNASLTHVANAGGYGYLNLTGGTYSQTANRFSITNSTGTTGGAGVVYVGGTGTLDLTGTNSMIIGYSGMPGSLTVGPGGIVTRPTAGNFWLTTNANSYGVLNIAGGSFETTGSAIKIGNGNAGPQTGFVNLAKGTLTLGLNGSNSINSAGASALYSNYAGGTLKAANNLTAVVPVTNANLTSISTIFAAIVNSAAVGDTSQDFTGGLTVDTNAFNATYTSPLLGATGNGVKQTNMTVTPGSGYIGAPMVQFTGGTGTPAAGYAVISGGAVTGIVITSPGDYTVDPTGVTLTGGGGTGASVALSALTPNDTDAGLTKINSGVLTLTAANTYAGATTINGGILVLSGSGAVNSSSGITINGSGAKLLQTSSAAIAPSVSLTQGILTGNGTADTVNVGAGTGAVVSNNDGVVGAPLTIGTLNFNGAATVNTHSSSTSAPIITTTLSSNAAGTVTINPSAAFWADGATYDLVSYGGGSIGGAGFGQFALGTVTNLSARQSQTLGNSGTAITLSITGDTPYWSGNGDGKWNVDSVNNWQLVSNNNLAVFLATDNVLFNDTATGAGPISVDIDLANVAPTSTTFNSSKDYVLNSTGGFGISSGALVKSGTGKVTLNTANTYAGGTTVNGGTLILGNASAIGTGTLTLSGGNLDSSVADLVNTGNNVQAWNSDFTFVGTQNLDLGTGAVTMSANRTVTVSANTLTVGGVIGGGAVGLTKLGAGTLNLKGTNTFTGAVAVNAGTLALSPSSALTMANTFTGTGTLSTNPGTGNLQLTGDLSGFSGTINVAPPVASPGKLVTGASSPLGIGTIVNIASGGSWFTNNTTQTGITVNLSGTGNGEGYGALRTDIGTIDSTSSIVLQSDSSIGGNTSTNTATINAVISENGGPFTLTKVGVNNLFLGGVNTYIGLTTVSAGSLILQNPSALGTTAGGTTVASGARVALDNVTVTGEAISISGNGSNFWGALQGRTGTNLWTGNVTIDSASDTRIGAAAGASLEVSGVIDDGVNDYRLMYRVADAAATVIISGNNTYTGGTSIVGSGPVVASSLNKVDGGTASSSFGAPVTEADGLIVFGSGSTAGILHYNGSGETTDRTIQIGINSAAPVVGDTGGATIENNGTTAALSFSAPTFNTPTDAVTGTSPARTLTLGGTNTAANTISGMIQNNQIAGASTAAIALTKTGAGSWTLAGANTYTGATIAREGILNLSGGFTGAGNRSISVSDTAGLNAILNISAGTYALGSGQINIGNAATTAATGTVNQSGGAISFTSGNGLLIGQNTVANQGIYNMSGGSITTFAAASRGIMLGVNSGASGGTFNLSETGVLNMTAASGGGGDAPLMIGRHDATAPNTTNLFNQTGGTANVGILSIGGSAALSPGGTHTLTLTGGVFSANQFPRLALGNDNTAVINIGGTADVTLPAFPTARGTDSTATINFDGGTLKPLVADPTYMAGLTNAFILDGGAKFDTTNGSITITQSLLTDGVSTGGGLTKDGTNTLTLAGANTYTGNTTVSAGTLALADNAQLKFVTGATSGTNNSIIGTGTVTIDGDFVIDTTLTDASALTSGTWTLVDAATLGETFGGSFTIAGAAWLETANVWTKTVGGKKYTFTEATGILTLESSAGYSSWAAVNAIGSTPDQDKDGDGVINAVEYVLGGDVNTNDLSKLPTVDASGANLVFTFKRKMTSIDGSTVVSIELDTDLSGWETSYSVPDTAVANNPGVTVVKDTPTGYDTITLTVQKGADTKKFAHLKVTVTP